MAGSVRIQSSNAELDTEVDAVMTAFADEEFIDIDAFVNVVAGNTFWMEAGELGDDPLQQLELREHSLALRAQMFGIWSDANHTPNAGCAPPLPPDPSPHPSGRG